MATKDVNIDPIAINLGWIYIESKQKGMKSYIKGSNRINIWLNKQNGKASIRIPQLNVILKNFEKKDLKLTLQYVDQLMIQPEGCK